MSIKMSRNNGYGQSVSNYENPSSSGPFVYYEQTYTSAGPQEWIFLPDAVSPCKVCISFQAPGAAFLEGTASPPNDVNGIAVPGTQGLAVPVPYTIVDVVTDTTAQLVQGDTAIRLNIVGGTSVTISVRC